MIHYSTGGENNGARKVKSECCGILQGFPVERPCKSGRRRSSFYDPGSQGIADDSDSTDKEEEEDERITLLNDMLRLSDKESIEQVLKVPWENACKKTKSYYVDKVREVMQMVVSILCPKSAEMVWLEL